MVDDDDELTAAAMPLRGTRGSVSEGGAGLSSKHVSEGQARVASHRQGDMGDTTLFAFQDQGLPWPQGTQNAMSRGRPEMPPRSAAPAARSQRRAKNAFVSPLSGGGEATLCAKVDNPGMNPMGTLASDPNGRYVQHPWLPTGRSSRSASHLTSPQISGIVDPHDSSPSRRRSLSASLDDGDDTSRESCWDGASEEDTQENAGRWEDLFHSSSSGDDGSSEDEVRSDGISSPLSPPDEAIQPIRGHRPPRRHPAVAPFASASTGSADPVDRSASGMTSFWDTRASSSTTFPRLFRPSPWSQTDGGEAWPAGRPEAIDATHGRWEDDSQGKGSKDEGQGGEYGGLGGNVDESDDDGVVSAGPGSSKLFKSIQGQVAALQAALGGGDFDSSSRLYQHVAKGGTAEVGDRDRFQSLKGSGNSSRAESKHGVTGDARPSSSSKQAATFVVVMGEGI